MSRRFFVAGLLSAVLSGGASGDLGALSIQPQRITQLDPAGAKEAPVKDSVPGSSVVSSPATGTPSVQQEIRSPEIIRTENFTLSVGARLQTRFTYADPDEGDGQGSFTIRRARMSLGGSAWQHFRYAMQMELAGGSVNILDANMSYRIAPIANLWWGQGKAHFGRQQLNSSGNLHFVDRTIVDSRFSGQRQAGIALTGQTEGQRLEYGLGVYNGNGINAANNNDRFMFAGRVVLTPFGAYSPTESAFDYPDSPRIAIGVGGLRNTTGTGVDETDITRLNVETAFKIQGFNATGEFYWEEADPTGQESLDTSGWYVQPGFLFPNRRNEVALRYAVISPDTDQNTDTIEIGAAFSHYWAAHRAKLQADVRRIERSDTDTTDLEFRLQVQLTL